MRDDLYEDDEIYQECPECGGSGCEWCEHSGLVPHRCPDELPDDRDEEFQDWLESLLA